MGGLTQEDQGVDGAELERVCLFGAFFFFLLFLFDNHSYGSQRHFYR